MAAPKYLEYDSSSGDIKQVQSVETGPATEQIVSTDSGGTVDLSLLPPTLALKADVQAEAYTYAADTGVANAYAVSLTPVPTIAAGSVVVFKAAHANTGASTIAVNGGSATAIKKESASGLADLASGDIQSGQIVNIVYDGTLWQMTSHAASAIGMGSLPADAITSVVGITIDGGGSTPSTGVKGAIQVPVPGSIIGWFAVADQTGSLTLEVDKHSSSSPPSAPSIPNTTTDKISASAPISLSTAQSASGGASAVSTWTTSIAQWDVIQFNLTAASTLQRVTIGIVILRS